MKKLYEYCGTSVMVCLCLMAIVTTPGCGKKENSATQVVARVDGQEISVHQLNAIVAKAGGIAPDNLPQVRHDVLEGLIEQQLAINAALAKKLDRSPEVVQALENAKREILARALMEQITSALTKPTDEDARKYYAENPALFSQRRIFSLQEISLRKNTPDIATVRAKVVSSKSLNELSQWLKERNIQFNFNEGARAAEQIPLEILPQIHGLKDGDIRFVEGGDAYLVIRMVQAKSAPVSESQAIPRIKQFLFNQAAAKALKAAKAEMRAGAKVEYVGEFAPKDAAAKAKADAEAKSAAEERARAEAKMREDAAVLAKQRAEEQAAEQAQAQARSQARSQARAQASKDESQNVQTPTNVNLEKGLKGLK